MTIAIVKATETVIGTNQFRQIGIPNKFSDIVLHKFKVMTSQSFKILITASLNTEEVAILK